MFIIRYNKGVQHCTEENDYANKVQWRRREKNLESDCPLDLPEPINIPLCGFSGSLWAK